MQHHTKEEITLELDAIQIIARVIAFLIRLYIITTLLTLLRGHIAISLFGA